MVDYIPVFVPGRTITLTASGAIVSGDLVVVSGSGTVAKCAVASAPNWIGVAGKDAAINAGVVVYGRGTVHESVADGTVTAGDQVVTSATTGRQVKTLLVSALAASPTGAQVSADINAARAVLGVALTTATDGLKVRWMEF